jgi:ADP-ribose pyrophosphatase
MNRIVNVIQRQEVFHRFVFRIDELKLQHERYDGSMSAEISRLILNRGDSVAMLLHDSESRQLLFCEQFRAPTLDKGPGWLLEVPAGMLEAGEDPEECARREAIEETGFSPRTLRKIACVYLSPGGSSERIHLFYAEVSLSDKIGAGGGLVEEGEDIRLIRMPTAEAIARAAKGEIEDAKTLIAIQWLDRLLIGK